MSQTCFIQRILAGYRDPHFEELNARLGAELIVCADPPSKGYAQLHSTSYELVQAGWIRICRIRLMPLRTFISLFRRCDRFIHFADFKYLSLWALLLLSLVTRKKVWLHGQGGYKRSSALQKFVYRLAISLSSGYICYTPYSAEQLKAKLPERLHHKIYIVDNTLMMDSVPETTTVTEDRLLYLGRLRPGCGIEFLLDATRDLGLIVDVIGHIEAEHKEVLLNRYPHAVFHGGIFELAEQAKIARACLAGIYGGDAGLSVLHYMALGLPVIVHDNISMHQGPEACYVKDGINGLTFNRGDADALAASVRRLRDDTDLRNRLAEGALATFRDLTQPSMAEKFERIVEPD